MIQWDDIKEQVGEWPSFRELFEAGGPHAQILGACVTGSAEYVQQVLAGDVTLANINKMGFTPIWLAVHFGNRAVSELLIGAGVDIHVPADRHPHDYPLHLAAKRGHVDVVALLLERGADVNARTRYGQTALHGAAERGHADVIGLLAQAGADLEVRGNADTTALQRAICSSNIDAALALVKAGANANADPSKVPDTMFLVQSEAEWPLIVVDGTRPLYSAVCCRLPMIVELLLDHGAEINALSYGWSALHAAAANADKDMVELLLRRGADPFIKSDVKSPLGPEYDHRTPMELLAGFRRSAELLRKAIV